MEETSRTMIAEEKDPKKRMMEGDGVIRRQDNKKEVTATTMTTTVAACCQMCRSKVALYKCPRCFVKTCSLECVKSHKLDRQCDGKRDRTAFCRVSQFTDQTLKSDYHFLEDVLAALPSSGKRQHNVPGIQPPPSNPHSSGNNNHAAPTPVLLQAPRKTIATFSPESEKCTQSISTMTAVGGDDKQQQSMLIERSGDNNCANDVESLQLQPALKRPKYDTPNGEEEDAWFLALPGHLKKLVAQARRRGTNLLLMPTGMERRKSNTTSHNHKADRLSWKVDFLFSNNSVGEDSINAGEKTESFVLDRVPEESTWLAVLSDALTTQRKRVGKSSVLTEWLSRLQNTSNQDSSLEWCLLMKKIPSTQLRYIQLDKSKSVRESLNDLTVIEYPTILVVPKTQLQNYPLLIQQVD
eukprot:scaffold5585_cov57-Attheya_sp.AAC.5